MAIQIPLSAIPNQEMMIVLDKQQCIINVYQRGDNMYLDLTSDNNVIEQGCIIIPKTPLLKDNSLFKGQFRLMDSKSKPTSQSMPNYKELGERFFLYFITESEEKENAKH